MTDGMPVVITDDIFTKAALEYCQRMNIEPFAINGVWQCRADTIRNELADLAERINCLKAVEAI